MKNPDYLRKDSLPVLNVLVKQFPYCQTVHLLLVKCLQNENDIQFNEQLKTSSAFVTDRKVLFNLLEENYQHTETAPLVSVFTTTDTSESKNQQEEIVLTKPELLPRIEADTMHSIETIPDSIQKSESTDLELSPEQILARRIKEIEEREKNRTPLRPAEGKTVISETKDNLPSQKPAFTEPTAPIEKQLSESEANPILSEKQTVSEKQVKTFTQWLKQKEKPKAEILPKPVKQSEIIEKFIETEPRISSPRSGFFSASDNARISVEESFDYVSETLAKIYFDQGSYIKALGAYEKLILLFPEKSAIFAAQIKIIRQILKEK